MVSTSVHFAFEDVDSDVCSPPLWLFDFEEEEEEEEEEAMMQVVLPEPEGYFDIAFENINSEEQDRLNCTLRY